MKANTAIGIAVSFFGLALGAIMEGDKLPAFLNIPAFLIVVVGTLGASLAGTGFDNFKKVPKLYAKAFTAEKPDLRAQVELMVRYAEMARREGLLALEDQLSEIDDEFTRKGLQLVVDGTDPELVREILENEMDAMAHRHALGVAPFEKAGGFAPTMGIIGTVMGLVHVLENLSQPDMLGPAISGAFIATLYGVGSANVVLLPTANKLKYLSAQEMELRTLTLEGVLSIQAGDNPRVVESKLMAFVPPEDREAPARAAEQASASEQPVAAGV
ncbi:MAG: flagellar motor protein [Thermoleophilaceae bacterium]|nr:flagellar motor protein [Thermoleophilaceae bacterium]